MNNNELMEFDWDEFETESQDKIKVANEDAKRQPRVVPNNYINSELSMDTIISDGSESNEADLVSHRHDYPHKKFRAKSKYARRNKQVEYLKTIPQHEQKSVEWLNQRKECLTATAVAIAIDEDPYKYPIELIMDKCGRGPVFIENANVHHGKKYEEIGTMFYAYRNNVKVAEYGLIQSDLTNYIGASPDGICEKERLDGTGLSSMVGRLLEIKFPKIREIKTHGDLNGDICPHYYYVQVQTQLYVTELDECDFLQCKIDEYKSWEEYLADTDYLGNNPGLSHKTNLEKGCLIQLLPKDRVGDYDNPQTLYHAQYLYPKRLHMKPNEIIEWIADQVMNFSSNPLSNDYVIDKPIYWRLSQVSCELIKFEKEWFESKIPILEQVFRYIQFYRKRPKLLNKLEEYVDEIGRSHSDLIFDRVHRDYKSVFKKTRLKPLYQEPTEWRLKYEEKRKASQRSYYANRKKQLNA